MSSNNKPAAGEKFPAESEAPHATGSLTDSGSTQRTITEDKEIKPDVVLIFSGGLDSTVLLHELLAAKQGVFALSFHYDQKHLIELDFATVTCHELGIEHLVVELPAALFGGSSQTDPNIPVPEGHYEAESMKLTVVPNRNMVMLALATSFAISKGARYIAYAAHSGDHAIYPDCRPAFVDIMSDAIALCSENPPQLLAPYIHKTKAEIVKKGKELGVDFTTTWSCYKGEEFHCGKCGTCVERKEAFELAGIEDPTFYA